MDNAVQSHSQAISLEDKFNTYCENIVFAILALGMIGFLYIFNITALDNGYSIVLKQVLYFFYAFLIFFFLLDIPQRFVQLLIRNIHIIFICNILVLIIAHITPLGAKINNATRWVKFGPVYLQPSEFLKYTTVLFIWWIYKSTNFQLMYKTILSISSIFLSAFLVGISPDIGTMAQIFLISFIIFFYTFPAKKSIVVPLILVAILGTFGFVSYKFSHIKKRIEAFKNPEVDLQNKNYQAHQLKISVYGTSLLGDGFGNSVQKLKYLPNAFNDFILGIIMEELGLLGLISLLVIFFYLFSNIIFCINLSSNGLGRMLLLSFFLYNLFNLLVNVLVCIGVFPVKGIALPFISLGGSYVVANLVFLGLAIKLNSIKKLE